MLAPEPFFEPRGTPFSEYHRIRALGELGYKIDLVTYPFGNDVLLPSLRIFRCARPPLMRRVRIGPSMAKGMLDVLLGFTAARRVLTERYDAIHSHEEAGLLGIWLAKWLGIPHLYDMHSSLPQQLSNFRYTRSGLLKRTFKRAEQAMIAGSRVVITVCQELQDVVVAAGAGDRAFLIENVMGGEVHGDGVNATAMFDVRARYGIGADQPLVLYTGTFEEYQGLDMLMHASACLGASRPDVRVLVVGGDPAQVEEARTRALALGSPMTFTGQRPAEEIRTFVRASDILVSPRISGTNTPLKIYTYLRSGRPIVATNLLTHTQVLNDKTAALVKPEPEAFAAAVDELIARPDKRAVLAKSALVLAATRYCREAYVSRTEEAYAQLLGNGEKEIRLKSDGSDARDSSVS